MSKIVIKLIDLFKDGNSKKILNLNILDFLIDKEFFIICKNDIEKEIGEKIQKFIGGNIIEDIRNIGVFSLIITNIEYNELSKYAEKILVFSNVFKIIYFYFRYGFDKIKIINNYWFNDFIYDFFCFEFFSLPTISFYYFLKNPNTKLIPFVFLPYSCSLLGKKILQIVSLKSNYDDLVKRELYIDDNILMGDGTILSAEIFCIFNIIFILYSCFLLDKKYLFISFFIGIINLIFDFLQSYLNLILTFFFTLFCYKFILKL